MGPTGTLTYTCSICAEPSHEICVYCTKDACHLHRCQRCLRCSDCCECESPLCLDEEPVAEAVAVVAPIEGVEPLEEPIEAEAQTPVEPPTEPPVEPGPDPDTPEEPEGLDATELDPGFPDGRPPGTWPDGSW